MILKIMVLCLQTKNNLIFRKALLSEVEEVMIVLMRNNKFIYIVVKTNVLFTQD